MFSSKYFTYPGPGDLLLGAAVFPLDEHELPRGQIRPFLSSEGKQLSRITFLGKVVGTVVQGAQQYLVIQAASSNPAHDVKRDFDVLHDRLWKEQSAFTIAARPISFWASEHRINDPREIYVHITSLSQMDTHASRQDEPWLRAHTPTLPLDPVDIDSIVFVVAHLFRIRYVHGETTGNPSSALHWIVRAKLLVRMHRPMRGAELERDDINQLLRSGIPLPTDNRVPPTEAELLRANELRGGNELLDADGIIEVD